MEPETSVVPEELDSDTTSDVVPASGELEAVGWASVLEDWDDSVELVASAVVEELDSDVPASGEVDTVDWSSVLEDCGVSATVVEEPDSDATSDVPASGELDTTG